MTVATTQTLLTISQTAQMPKGVLAFDITVTNDDGTTARTVVMADTLQEIIDGFRSSATWG